MSRIGWLNIRRLGWAAMLGGWINLLGGWINLLGGCQVGCGAILGSTPTHIGDDGDEGVGDGEGQALRRA